MRMSGQISYEVRGQIGLIQIDNPPVNALSVNKGILQGILDAIKSGDHDPQVNAFLVIGAGRNFSGGADISEFGKDKTPGMATLTDLLAYMDTVTKPIVAAVSGPTMGGGLELALTCHYRVADETAVVALPEVKLGILPGAGGTQRLPRLIGAERALDVMTTGEFIPAKKALDLGVIDELISGDLLDGAITWLKRSLRSGLPIKRASQTTVPGDLDVAQLISDGKELMSKKWRGFPAPLAIVSCVEAALTQPFKEGLKVERQEFEKLVVSTESKSLRHLFFSERQANKVSGVDKATPVASIESVAVIGAGTMGGGITMNFLNVGIPVTLIEMNQEALDKGVATIKRNYDATVKKGRLSETARDERLSLLTSTTQIGAAASADLIIEAVYE
jgi:3-hydroxyacyl-CoA dehydrogenase